MTNINYSEVIILGYTLLSLIINIKTVIERYRKRHMEQVKPPSWLKFNLLFLIIAIIGILVTRGFVFILAIAVLTNPLLKTVSLVLLIGDLLFLVVFGFDKSGKAMTLTTSEYNLRTYLVLCETSFIFYFLIYYLLNIIS